MPSSRKPLANGLWSIFSLVIWRQRRGRSQRNGRSLGSVTTETGAHLAVLVGGDRHEGRLREGEGLEDAPADAEQVVSLDQVETRMVAMHRVQDDLEEEEEEQEEEEWEEQEEEEEVEEQEEEEREEQEEVEEEEQEESVSA